MTRKKRANSLIYRERWIIFPDNKMFFFKRDYPNIMETGVASLSERIRKKYLVPFKIHSKRIKAFFVKRRERVPTIKSNNTN